MTYIDFGFQFFNAAPFANSRHALGSLDTQFEYFWGSAIISLKKYSYSLSLTLSLFQIYFNFSSFFLN